MTLYIYIYIYIYLFTTLARRSITRELYHVHRTIISLCQGCKDSCPPALYGSESAGENRDNLRVYTLSSVTIETPQTAPAATTRHDGASGARVWGVVEESIAPGPTVPRAFASSPMGIVRLHILGCDVNSIPDRPARSSVAVPTELPVPNLRPLACWDCGFEP